MRYDIDLIIRDSDVTHCRDGFGHQVVLLFGVLKNVRANVNAVHSVIILGEYGTAQYGLGNS